MKLFETKEKPLENFEILSVELFKKIKDFVVLSLA